MDISSKQKIESFLRVNHAGESAAVRLYEGQLSVLAKSPSAVSLKHMHQQEMHHRHLFEQALSQNNATPSLLNPLWHRLSYGVGVATALMGTRTAMDCTVAVEEVIEKHYKKQLQNFPTSDKKDIKTLIQNCYEDEIAHKDVAENHNDHHQPQSPKLFKTIQVGCKLAIWLSERI